MDYLAFEREIICKGLSPISIIHIWIFLIRGKNIEQNGTSDIENTSAILLSFGIRVKLLGQTWTSTPRNSFSPLQSPIPPKSPFRKSFRLEAKLEMAALDHQQTPTYSSSLPNASSSPRWPQNCRRRLQWLGEGRLPPFRMPLITEHPCRTPRGDLTDSISLSQRTVPSAPLARYSPRRLPRLCSNLSIPKSQWLGRRQELSIRPRRLDMGHRD